jgi:hypothetical protein
VCLKHETRADNSIAVNLQMIALIKLLSMEELNFLIKRNEKTGEQAAKLTYAPTVIKLPH